ncbi:MAG: glycosyltransferase family 1 protein [Candidatus Spechtbacterales bacterium]
MLHIGIDGHNLEGNRAGVGRYLESILAEYARNSGEMNDVRITVYTKRHVPSDEALRHPMFRVRCLKIWPRSSFFLYFLFLLPWAAWRDKVDVMWFPTYMVPHTWRGPSVIVLHDVMFARYPERFSWRYRMPYTVFSRYGAHHSKRILTASEFSKREIVDLYHVPTDKVVVTPLAVDKKFFAPQETPATHLKAHYGIEGDYLLWVGQIFNRRNVHTAMQAFGRIAGEFPRVQMLVAGKDFTEPPLHIDQLAEEVNKKSGRKAILRTLYIAEKDLVSLMGGARAGCYLSDYEGFGLPPLEFLATGTPVLAPNATALATTLGGEQVVVDDPADVGEVALTMRKVLTDSAYQQRAREGGPRQASRFSWEQTARTTLKVLREAAASTPV